jgi:hypothetical protein
MLLTNDPNSVRARAQPGIARPADMKCSLVRVRLAHHTPRTVNPEKYASNTMPSARDRFVVMFSAFHSESKGVPDAVVSFFPSERTPVSVQKCRLIVNCGFLRPWWPTRRSSAITLRVVTVV